MRRHLAVAALAMACALCGLTPGKAASQDLNCASPPFEAPPEIRQMVSALAPAFEQFPAIGASLFQDLRALCLAPNLHDSHGYFEADERRIVIDARLPPALRSTVLIHELRHLQQQDFGTCPAPDLSMTQNARAIYAMEADASAISHVVAWQLRESGQTGMWDALASYPLQADIAEAFAREMARSGDPRAAASVAFAQWYARAERRELYYIAACSDYLERNDRTHRLPSYARLTPNFFARLCKMPDGHAYSCADAG
ncbi:DUF6782 family putative metallopeptidase [Pseudothioclava nitratireducens]|uniref:DUF6782 family putative metallopeptidase n=1 Tax=Pseudothioclava nitratireducens TaxID=1928646 RepID=UPI0023DC56DA|nr:DUF6782 family putative metallopeptidase [Defluviimonas nitratireducens]MDF1620272.1 hypothetical protein [Defluviimonas nitratireducens]